MSKEEQAKKEVYRARKEAFEDLDYQKAQFDKRIAFCYGLITGLFVAFVIWRYYA